MARRKLTEREMDDRFARLELVCKTITRVLSGAFRYGCFLGIGYFLFDALKEFVGKTTVANILIQIVTDLKMNQWFGFVAGGGGLIYGGVRSRQLKQTRKEHANHIKQLELKIDPNRQSSRLNLFGETHEDDR